jgi:ectoine hydroxylase-related dioxygenase (phytanoyl-CoA dioxygenase family)
MEIIGDYARDGAVCIRGALDAAELDLARRAIDANLAELSPGAKRASGTDDGAFIEDFCSWQRIPELEALVRTTSLAQRASELMGSQHVRFFHDHVLVKEPGTSQRTPWHQDIPYYNVEGSQNVSIWIPVDPVPRPVTLEFVAGSHLGPWYMPRSFLDEQAKWFPEGSLAELPDIASDPERYRVLGWELEPGDVVCFHMQTLHRAAGNPGPGRRRVVSLRFLGDDMVHAPRPWVTSPDFPGLADRLPRGAAMDDPLFPLLW